MTAYNILMQKIFLNNRFIALILLISALACDQVKKSSEVQNPLFELKTPEESGVNFINSVENEKNFNIMNYRNFYNGGGVAIGDINNDGLSDIYLTANRKKNKLFLNKGNFQFEDITLTAGVEGKKSWSTGVVMVDINADGFLDIYVCNAGNIEDDDRKNELFINNGDNTFTEQASKYGLANSGFTTHTAFFDYDLDGDLDAYILNNSFIQVSTLSFANKRDLRAEQWNVPEQYKGGGDKLLRNDDGIFIDVSEEAGIYGSLIGFGLGVTIGDVNKDLLPDIYISNDFYERDYLYINKGDGTFNEEVKDWMQHLSLSSMGADMADINNDGYPEIFATDMHPEEDKRLKETGDFENYNTFRLKKERDFYNQFMQNTLQLNNGDGSFSEIAYQSGVARTDWSWGALLFDMDNDGYRDIFVSNGIYHDLINNDFMDFFANDIIREMVITGEKEQIDSIINKMPSTPIANYTYRNKGDLSFENISEEWGLANKSFSNGAAYGDLDNDGDLDLVVNNVNMPVFVYENKSERLQHNFIKVQIKGEGLNTQAIGSTVELYIKDEVLRQEHIPSRGFQSSIDYRMTIGIGKHSKIDSLKVTFPDQKTLSILNPELNQTITADQKDGIKQASLSTKTPIKTIFKEVPTILQLHKEDSFTDFDYEGLIAKASSREGPALAVGDIDNDGQDDVYLGGAAGQKGQIYLQKKSGELTPGSFSSEAIFEDTDAVFSDINNDTYLDLIVASGGNFPGSRTGVRAYINDGKGNFGDFQVLSFSNDNINTIAPYDYDNDGDIDLFVGALSVKNTYGLIPSSKLLENRGNLQFVDVTAEKASETRQAGMITKALWEDIDQDTIKDLILVGEWMAPQIFRNNNGILEPIDSNLNDLHGLWNTVHSEDLNNDGKLDLILGNRGTNAIYSASPEEPMKLFVSDFDNNSIIEQIITRTIEGRDIPIHTKRELTGQLNFLKKKNIRFDEYATKSIQDLFTQNTLNRAKVYSINTFESIIAYNEGNGQFRIEALPFRAQLSCICDIATKDLNNDGIKDIITAGNQYSLKPQFSRLDASFGEVILSNDQGYSCQSSKKSGFKVKGETRALRWLKDKNDNRYLLAGINNAKPKLFKVNE